MGFSGDIPEKILTQHNCFFIVVILPPRVRFGKLKLVDTHCNIYTSKNIINDEKFYPNLMVMVLYFLDSPSFQFLNGAIKSNYGSI
jgi:hypothetical protein